MEIKKFNDMKAYLLKPNRLFSSNNSRENFKFGSVPGEGNSRIEYDPETNTYRKRVQETIDGKKTSKYIFSQPGQSLEDFKQIKPVRSTEAIDATVKARQFIDDWTKNWFDNNLKNYGVRDFEVMLNDLSNDWNEVLESTDAPKASAQFKLSTPELNLPNITSGKDVRMKKGSIEPFTYNDVRFYSNLEGSKDQLSKTLSQYKKVFYKNKIETDPELRTGLKEFFDFMSADKRGLYKKLDGKTIKDFMNTVSDDVKFLLDAEISGLDKASKNKVFNSYGDLADNYNKFTQDKVRLKAVQAETEAIAKAGKKTADQYKKIKETIKKQNDVLAKMSVEDIAKNKKLLNSVRMVINPKTGEVSYTNYTVKDPKGKPVLTDLELAEKIKQKAKDKNFYVTEHIGKKSLNKANLAYPNNIQSANYMSNSQLENARRFLINSENRNTPAAQNLDKALEQTGLTIRGSEYGGQRFGNKIDIVVPASTGRSSLVDSQLIDTKKTGSSQIKDLLKIEGVKRASEIDRPEAAVTRDMFTNFNERIANAKNIPLNEVEQDVSNVSKVLNEMSSKMSSGVDPKDIIKYVGAEAKDLVEFGKKYGGDALGKIGKTVIGLDLPIMQVAFASMQDWEEDSPLWVTLPAAFTDEVANAFNLYNKTGGKAKEFGKFLASSFVPRAARSPLFKAVSKVGKGASLAAPILELGQEAYKFEKQKRMLPEIARQFDIPIEEARKGFQNYIRSTIPQDPAAQGMDELSVPESPGLPRLKRTFQDIGSLFGFGESPYKDPNAKEESAILPKAKPSLTERGFVAEGGRMGFADGPKNPKKGLGSFSKRNFLKTLALIPAGIMAIRGGPNLLKKAKPAIEAAKGMPEWFGGLVDKVIETGTDITKQFAKQKGEQVFIKQLGEAEGVRVTKNLETGKIKVDYDSPTNMGEDTVTFTYIPGTKTKKGENIPAQFEVSELEPRGVRMGPDDYEIEFDGEHLVEDINFLESDTSSLKQFATGKLDEKDLKLRQEKVKRVENINNDQTAQAEYLETKYGPSSDDANDYDLNYQDYSDYD